MELVDKRRMCPQCRAMITTDDKVCPYCQAQVGARAIDVRSPDNLMGGLMPANRFVTSLLLLVNAAIFLTIYVSSNKDFLTSGYKDGRAILYAGEWWRLITAGYLHANLLHIGMNAWAIFDMGAFVEDLIGAKRMFTVYTVATVCGFLLSSWWNPVIPSLGASAGAFGLIGALIAYGVNSRSMQGDAIKRYYIESAVFGIVVGLIGIFPIDNAAHLGGLVGGFLTAWVAGEARLVNDWKEKVWTMGAALSLILTLAAFARMYLRFLEISAGK